MIDTHKASRPNRPSLKQLHRAERTQAALFAFDNNLNVFPVAYGHKLPIKSTPVQPLDYMRLFWHESEIRKLFSDYDVNLAVKLGETSWNTFVLDIDDPGRAIEIMMRIASRQIRTLIVKSPNRGYHFYFSCTDCAVGGAELIDTKTQQKFGDLKGQGGYVLFAGSMVDGKYYTLVDASKPYTDSLSNLQAVLSDVLHETIVLKRTSYGRDTWRAALEGEFVTQRGRWIGKYCEYLTVPTPIGSRKNTLLRSTHYAIATGKSLDAVESAAQRDGLPQSEIDRTIAAAERKHDYGHGIAAGGQTHHWHTALQAINIYHGWERGQKGNTERAVMLALIERARKDANEQGVFRASIREIKQIAQKSYTPSVNNAINSLIAKGLIVRVSGSRQRDSQDCALAQPVNGGQAASVTQKLSASHWKFGSGLVQNLHSKELRSNETDISTVYITHHLEMMQDTRKTALLERGELGQTAIRIYNYLLANNGAPSQGVIARALEVDRSTVGRALHKMESCKLVEYQEDDSRWYARPLDPEQWAELAPESAIQRYEARKARFGKERHENLLHIYFMLLKPYQKRLEWHERQELATDPLLAEAFDLGATIEHIA